jgi:hypothetical protein
MAKNTQKRRANRDGWVYQDGPQWRFKLADGVDPVTGKLEYRGGRATSHAEATEKLRECHREGCQVALGHGTAESQRRVANALSDMIAPKAK